MRWNAPRIPADCVGDAQYRGSSMVAGGTPGGATAGRA